MEDIIIKHIEDFNTDFIEELCRLEIENLGKEASVNQWVLPVLIRYGLVSIAEKLPHGETAGVCQVLRGYRNPSLAFIYSFYIRPHLRGRRIGRLLLEGVLKKLITENIEKVELTVDPDNIPAASLYTSTGFKRIVTRKDEYGKSVNRDLYRMILR
jgi:ribosomal protein S18 acetylase RimI-like enzyme